MPSILMETWLADRFGPAWLVLLRVAGLAATAPGWGAAALGARIRMALAVLVTAIVLPAVGPRLPRFDSLPTLAWAGLGEAATGAAIGLVLGLVVAAARQAGELIGSQAGLAPAMLLDPEAGAEMNPLGHLYGLIALGLFLAQSGPVTLVTALVESYRALPVGGAPWGEAEAARWFGQVGWALGLSLRIALPVAVALIVAGLALGLLGRVAAGLSLLTLAWPVRWAVGLLLVLLGLVTMAALLADTWAGALAGPFGS